MTDRSIIDRLLLRDRAIVLAGLVVIAGLVAAYTVAGIGEGRSALEMTTMASDMLMTPAVWTPGYALLVFLMWWTMMIAMMLPSAAPTVLLYAAIKRRRADVDNPLSLTAAFLSGFVVLWGLFSLLATALQWSLELTGLLSPMLSITSRPLSALILVMAAVYQFTPIKHACLTHCQHPIRFLTRGAGPGLPGAWWLGVRHGVYCASCCLFLMSLLFVGGIMNIYWIGGLALYILLEKLLPDGRRMSYLAGVVLLIGGIVQLVSVVIVGS
jgi:predicted metal-binding membrane protein